MIIMILILALIVPISIFLIRMTKKRPYLPLLLLAVISSLILECSVFNVRHYQSRDYEPSDVRNIASYRNMNLVSSDPDVYEMSGTVTIEIKDLKQKVNNIYLDLAARDSDGEVVSVNVTVYMTDESNENYLTLPSQSIMGNTESTKYLFLVTNGESHNLKITFSSSDAETFSLGKISINEVKPFNFSILRVLFVSFVLALAFILRPKSPIYEEKLSFSKKQLNILFGIASVQIIILIVISSFNPVFVNTTFSHHTQYADLADAFLDGQLHLKDTPPEYLAEMENPYDYAARRNAAKEAGENYAWDTAYYNGHYYVYFGVLPVLLFYLPFKALTGLDLPNISVIQILLVLFVIAAFLILSKIAKKYFDISKIPFVSFILTSLIFVNASGAVFIAKRPDFYSIPILLALTLTLLGLYFWLRALDDEDKVSPLFGALGSLCMALTAASRPQFLLASVFAVVIFWSAVFKGRTLFSKKGARATISMCLPYVLVAAAVMWYNFARFGSPFDFGQNYNLTTNDMTGRGFRVERIGLAIFTYFFQLPNYTATFPFLTKVAIKTNYLGTTITEAMFGGIFATIPLLWLIFLVPSKLKELKKGKTLPFIIVAVALAFIIGIADAQGAGLLARYVSDFSYLALLAATLILFHIYERTQEHEGITRFLNLSFFATGAYSFLSIFAIYATEIFYNNPTLFYTVSELVQFWR